MLFGLVIAASLLNNICFIALKVVRVHEHNLWREGNFDINEVQSQESAAVSSNMAFELLIISGAVQRLRTFVSFWFIIPGAFILLYLPFNISAAIFRSFQVVILITIISTRAVRKISQYFP